MTRQEFERIVDDVLSEGFGQNSYSPKMLNKLWNMMEGITASEFRHILDNLALTSVKAPSLMQIRSAALPAINRALEDIKRAKIAALDDSCKLCLGSGWVHTKLRVDESYEFAFICTCEASRIRGIKVGKGASYWRPELEEKYLTFADIEKRLPKKKDFSPEERQRLLLHAKTLGLNPQTLKF